MTHNRIKTRRWWAAILRAVCGITIFVLFGAGTSQALDHHLSHPDLISSSGLIASVTLANVVADAPREVGTVDPIAPNQQVGHSRYLAQCSSCHLPVPAAVLPRETWGTLLTDTAHYGVVLPPLTPFDQQLIWNYLRTYSRSNWGSRIPAFRVTDSVYFTALHPDVTFERPVRLNGCVTCHAQANAGNFRQWTVPSDNSMETLDEDAAP